MENPSSSVPPCRSGSEAEVIDLLLEEYRTLRSEVVARVQSRTQLTAFAVAGTGLVASTRSPWLMSFAGLLILIGAVVWIRSQSLLESLGRAISQLEKQIDSLASIAYETSAGLPLSWETQQLELRKDVPRARPWRRQIGLRRDPMPRNPKSNPRNGGT
jgi:hypothetical protein